MILLPVSFFIVPVFDRVESLGLLALKKCAGMKSDSLTYTSGFFVIWEQLKNEDTFHKGGNALQRCFTIFRWAVHERFFYVIFKLKENWSTCWLPLCDNQIYLINFRNVCAILQFKRVERVFFLLSEECKGTFKKNYSFFFKTN